jgi:uncharacterized damage-inducible protein DinB
MTMIDSLSAEFQHEAQTTRKHLERLSDDTFAWRPHEKSFTTGELASHIVDCIRWAEPIFNSAELDIDPATFKEFQASSVADLLTNFDEATAKCAAILSGVDEDALMQSWQLKVKGRSLFEKPRAAVLRDFILSHLIHHRGQLSVYLRLLNIPVPGSYGPSADELESMRPKS